MDTYRTLLDTFISYKSVSTDAAFVDEMQKTADYLVELFTTKGFKAQAIAGYGNPIVVAHYDTGAKETVLIYGHYDVQPAEGEGWHADPFTVYEDEERLYARGIIDNKGQVLVHIATVFDLIDRGELGYNVTFMIEGDEETGSDKMEQFFHDHQDKLACDFTLISDGEITAGNMVLEAGFRGGFNATVTVATSHTDLHSGLYGGATPNAGWVLSHFLAGLHDDRNLVAIDHFYDDVDAVSTEQKAQNEQLPFTEEEFKRLSGTKALKVPEGSDYYTQTGLQPTVEITGVQIGYTGVGYKNAIPGSSQAKLNFRLVASQDAEKTAEQFIEYARKVIPEYAEVTVEVHGLHNSIKLSFDNQYVKKAAALITEITDTKPLQVYCGGGIPIVALFAEILQVPQVLLPLANEDCNMHGTNENFAKKQLERSLKISNAFLRS